MSTISHQHVAEGIAEALRTRQYGLPVTVRRAYTPRFDLEAMTADVQIVVVPRSVTYQQYDRRREIATVSVDIGIGQLAPPGAEEQIAQGDRLADLVQGIVTYLQRRRITIADSDGETADYPVDSVANDPIFDPERLREGAFVSLVTCQILVSQEVRP